MTSVLAGLAVCAVTALAQPTTPAPPEAPKEITLDDLPAPLKLGVRADRLREQRPVVPIVVVVPDAASYVEAVAHWTPEAYYPVLIFDGSMQSLEDIARFVRGFAPKSVVRWSHKVDGKPAPWPTAAKEKADLVERALARSWGVPAETHTHKALIDQWKKAGLSPPGLVVAGTDDPAWTAALALASGHAQPIIWVGCKQGVGGVMSPAEADALESVIEQAAEKTGLAWKGLGDDLDAIALCLNCPAKMTLVAGGPDGNDGKRPAVKPGDEAATTDRIGRFSSPADHSVRWAWASQVFGAERQAAYRAMCSLFIQPNAAWLFDGYGTGKPWSDWDCTSAAQQLEKAGYKTIVDDTPHQGRADWRARAGAPLDAGLVFVNSKGECFYFDLEPGRGRPGDTPLMNVPTIVHFVHSWSLQYPSGRETVGGRWIDNGAYCYFGSVHEPFLTAFVPTPLAAARLAGSAPWCAVGRVDGQPMWRLACVGDPLMTLGPPAKRLEGEKAKLSLEGAEDIEAEFKSSAKAENFGVAIRLMTMLGEDAKAARLSAAIAGDQPEKFTPDVALASLFPLARSGKADVLAAAYAKLDEKTAADSYLKDALWLGTLAELSKTTSKELLTVLRKNLRVDQAGRDALDLFPAWQRVFGKPAAVRMLTEVRDTITEPKKREEIVEALKGLKE